MRNIIGSLDPSEGKVYIWGAGFSGLVLGYYLKKAGLRVTIYEKEARAGGKIQTLKTPAGLSETGANALFLNYDGLELLEELKMDILPASPKLKRLLFLDGKARSPFRIKTILKVASRLHRRPPLLTDGLSVADFFRPLLGDELISQYLSTVLGGVYATTADNLHFKSLFWEVASYSQFKSYYEFFKTLMKIKKSQPRPRIKGSVSFEGGMGELVNRLYELLKDDIRLSTHQEFYPKKNTVICTDAHSAADLLEKYRPEMSEELRRINYQMLSSVTIFLHRQIKPLVNSFGVLIPKNSNFHASGILNNKAIFPANNPNIYSYTLISPQKLTEEQIKSDLRKLQPSLLNEDFEFIQINYWQKAIPLYDLNRYLAIDRLHTLAQDTNLCLFGNYVAGISLREMVSAAKKFAADIKLTGGSNE
ncbi:MAG TPA: FAD-dependent oxidoreductase [Bacteriovoracaceae bacterium]|nr:FAD-dependent oxidoreductase [Bacteriovoracaceae bacterium]